ncbi:hypothetical protein F8M41_020557 [Gigaspora margarita]|uniref:Uncharacterized protein n=1 Tax=Gigaspora margarita TaxID=4874 RepID=A0A8H4B1Q9_GIGMA|nr:hypothetical protein F8M41_020557 [Gigaspora margarita]
MDENPKGRPTAFDVYKILQDWEIILDRNPEELSEKQLEVKNAFLKANETTPMSSSPTSLQYQNFRYTSQAIESLEDAGSNINIYIDSYTGKQMGFSDIIHISVPTHS